METAQDGDNPFEEYYRESLKDADPTPRQPAPPDPSKDAASIKAPINGFISGLNALIGLTFQNEQAKKTRPDLIVTLIIGGLAFTMANVFFMITRNFGSSMDETEYRKTFLDMYETALRDIKRNKEAKSNPTESTDKTENTEGEGQ